MSLTLQIVEKLAPDQASLTAAKKLLSNTKWQNQGMNQETTTVWGECLGSGSKPYYVVAETTDHGYKCTCPSRKFPCKHTLALMWRFAENQERFTEEAMPTWVSDWLGRRRKTSNQNTPEPQNDNKNAKSIAEAQLDDEVKALDPKKIEAAKKRAEKLKQTTDSAISAGLFELKQWLIDQLRQGIGAFLDDMSHRCRHIAARLVDYKATVIASRLDDMPALILSYPKDVRAKAVIAEFTRLYLLCQAWQKNSNDADVRQAITQGDTKTKISENPDALRYQGLWRVIGEFSENKKDGLISQVTYLVRINKKGESINAPNFALILDYHHASVGTVSTPSQLGDYLEGQLCFYPSKTPLRAFFEHFQTKSDNLQQLYFVQNSDNKNQPSQPQSFDASEFEYAGQDLSLPTCYFEFLAHKPYAYEMPFMLKGGLIVKQNTRFWYQNNSTYLPLANKDIPLGVLIDVIDYAFILWQADRARLLSVVKQTGEVISCLI